MPQLEQEHAIVVRAIVVQRGKGSNQIKVFEVLIKVQRI